MNYGNSISNCYVEQELDEARNEMLLDEYFRCGEHNEDELPLYPESSMEDPEVTRLANQTHQTDFRLGSRTDVGDIGMLDINDVYDQADVGEIVEEVSEQVDKYGQLVEPCDFIFFSLSLLGASPFPGGKPWIPGPEDF